MSPQSGPNPRPIGTTANVIAKNGGTGYYDMPTIPSAILTTIGYDPPKLYN